MRGQLAPGGRGLLGHLPDIRKDSLAFFEEAMRTSGPVPRLRLLHKTAHLACTPSSVKRVLVDNPKNYDKSTPGFRTLRLVFGNGLFVSDGEFWKKQRRLLQPAFHRDVLKSFVETMWNEAEALGATWEQASTKTRDITQDMSTVTMQIVAKCILSSNVTSDVALVTQNIDTFAEQFRWRTRQLVKIPLSVPTPANRALEAANRGFDDIVYRMLAERRAKDAAGSSREHRDLLDLLMGARDEVTGEAMSDRQIRDEVITFFLAGHETTALALGWTLSLLSLHPEITKRVVAEIETALPNGTTPTMETLAKLELTGRVFKEALRLYPPAFTFGRMPLGGDALDGCNIEPGEIVFVSPYAVHHNPDIWENPRAFDPDRFLPDAEAKRPKCAYIPFGAGPRICIGLAFAHMEAQLVLASLLRRHRIVLANRLPVPEPSVTLRPRDGFQMVVSAR